MEDFQALGQQAEELIAKQSWTDQEKTDAMNMLREQAKLAMERMEAEKANALSSMDVDVAKLAANIINSRDAEQAAITAAEANGPADVQMSKKTVSQAELELYVFAKDKAEKLRAEAAAHPEDELARDLDMLLDLEAGASSSARQGWFWSPPPPPPPAPSCRATMLNGHTHGEIVKAAHLAKLVYTKGGFDSIHTFSDGSNAHLQVAYYLENGQHDLDFGEADSTDARVGWIVFAGSESTDDWMQNFKIWPTPMGYNVPGWVEYGFRQQYLVGRDHALNYVRTKVSQGVTKFFVVGHSLGGAVASLAAVDLQTNVGNAQIHMVTFAAPAPGDGTWASHANNILGSRMSRLQISNDPVPCIPPGYSHDLRGLLFYNHNDNRWVSSRDYS